MNGHTYRSPYSRVLHANRMCVSCGNPVPNEMHWNRKTCSDECQYARNRLTNSWAYKARRAQVIASPNVCVDCGGTFDRTEAKRQRKRCPGCWDRNRVSQAQRGNRDKKFRQHNISVAKYSLMLKNQDCRCAVCASSDPKGRGDFHIDHDHACCPGSWSCGKCIRGLLCATCNSGLGMFGDDPVRLISAAFYIVLKKAELAGVEYIDLNEWFTVEVCDFFEAAA